MDPANRLAWAINALWDELEKGAVRARAFAARPAVKLTFVASALALATGVFLVPNEMTGRLRESIGLKRASARWSGERLFVPPDEKSRPRFRSPSQAAPPALKPVESPAAEHSAGVTSAQASASASARSASALAGGEGVQAGAASEVQAETVAGPQELVKGETGAPAPAPKTVAPAPVAAAAPPPAAAAPKVRAPAAHLSAAPRRLEASRGFGTGEATKISASSLVRLGDGPTGGVQATAVQSSNDSGGGTSGAGGSSFSGSESGGGSGAASGAATLSGKSDSAPVGGPGAGGSGGGGAGGVDEGGGGPGGSSEDKKKCDAAQEKYGPEREAALKRMKEFADQRAAMGRTCRDVPCNKAFCDALVCRTIRICSDGGDPKCLKQICEQRRVTTSYRTYCRCADLRCDYRDSCRKANEANCNHYRGCPPLSKRECNTADCSL